VGWIATLGALGDILDIPGFFDVQIFFVGVMACIWLVLIVLTAIAFKRGLILCAKDEVVLKDLERKTGEA
jgi:hypothetical protein